MANDAMVLTTFLPPHLSIDAETFKTLTVIGTKPDSVHLSSDILFLRISSLSLRLLTLAMAAVYNDEISEDIQGDDLSGRALQHILSQPPYRDKIIYIPADWFNHTTALFTQPYSPTPIQRLLAISPLHASQEAQEAYPSPGEVEAFWTTLKDAELVLSEARERGHTEDTGDFKEEVRNVRYLVDVRSWGIESLREEVERLKARLGIGEVVGYEAVVG